MLSPLLFATACIDTGLHPGGKQESAPAAEDSAGSACDLAAPATAAATAAATCSPLEAVDWELAVEMDYQNLVEAGAGAYIGAPVAARLDAEGDTLLLFQSGVRLAVDSVRGLDPLTGEIVWRLDGVGGDLDHLAIARDAVADNTGSARLAIATSAQGVECASADASTFEYLANFSASPAVRDLTHDGRPEIYQDPVVLDAECSVLYEGSGRWGNVTPVLFDTTGAFEMTFANSEGVTSFAGGTDAWVWGGVFDEPSIFHFAVLADGGEPRVVIQDSEWLLLAQLDGEVIWSHRTEPAPDGYCQIAPAVGDVDGDGRPEIIACETDRLSAFDLDGSREWSVRVSTPGGGGAGVSMADLDADGRYEVVHWSENGLRILEGATGATLSVREDITTRAFLSEPIIADVDADGSAEIVVSGDWVEEAGESNDTINDHLFVLGPSTGRWARTRPVWNQTAYDITTVRDDGAIVRFPRTSWQTYNAFRAQPSHDGDHPDLTVEVTDSCVDACDAGGTIQLAVQASNLGSREAPAGATIRLYSWSEATGVKEVGAATVPTTIPAGWAAEGVVFSVAWEDWGEGRFVEIEAIDADDCDLVNSRVDVFTDPCGAGP